MDKMIIKKSLLKQLIREVIENHKAEDLATIKEFTEKFKSKFASKFENFKPYRLNKPDITGDGAESIFTETFKPPLDFTLKGDQWRDIKNSMIWLNSGINPAGVKGPNDIARIYTIHYELYGKVKLFRRRSFTEGTTLKFHSYNKTQEGILNEFAKWIQTKYEPFMKPLQ